MNFVQCVPVEVEHNPGGVEVVEVVHGGEVDVYQGVQVQVELMSAFCVWYPLLGHDN